MECSSIECLSISVAAEILTCLIKGADPHSAVSVPKYTTYKFLKCAKLRILKPG